MQVYNKLVRDKIPEIIEANGDKPTYETLKDDRYLIELNKKLLEEANEFIEANDPEELADLMEVVYAITTLKNIDLTDKSRVFRKKLKKIIFFK